jgi:rhamnosyltransferase
MVYVVIPTLNAAADWPRFGPALLACIRPEQVLIIDSASEDDTVALAKAAGIRVCSIQRAEFNHGGTRMMAARMLPDADILVYLTQDAILTDSDAIANLVRAFDDPGVAAAYGRQLPRPGAGAIEAHARTFNYPSTSNVRDLASRDRLGFRAIFLSNSLSAYRRSALLEVGGFPSNVIFGEDTVTAAHLLLAGHKIAYVSGSSAYHSHAYTWLQEFKRYFDIGVLHSREKWLLDAFGRANKEGRKFIVSELTYLFHHDIWQTPAALIRTGLKLSGYRLGRMESRLSHGVKRRLSMHSAFWAQ